MIQLHMQYSTKQLAEALSISYKTLRNNKEVYEKHLALFYDYDVMKDRTGVYYTFTDQIMDYIPYKEYKKQQRNELITKKIKSVIAHDPRQTGANIGRIIFVDGEIQALNYELSTLTSYTRANLKELVNQGYYTLSDYRWCILDNNCYIELNKEQVEELRSYFAEYDGATKEEQENIMAQRQEGLISKNKANEKLGDMKFNAFILGIQKYQNKYNHRPIKVPVYERNAIMYQN